MVEQSRQLTLAGQSFSEPTSWRRGREVIDALPYIDSLDATEKEAVMKIINEEVCLCEMYHSCASRGCCCGETYM